MWYLVFAIVALGFAWLAYEVKHAGICPRCEGMGTVWEDRTDGPVICPTCRDEWR